MSLLRNFIQRHKPAPFDRRRIFLMLLCLGCFSIPGTTFARQFATVTLAVQLRYADGTAVANEPVTLERLPEAGLMLPACRSDDAGRCSWDVTRGLYQLHFNRPLDAVSAQALAEGGLSGLGISVGDKPITYHFTFHSDGRVYFDSAPEAAVPAPMISEGELLHGGVEATATSSPNPTEGSAITTTPSPQLAAPEQAVDTATSDSNWRILLFISGGLCVGGGLHLWLRKRNKPVSETTRRSGKETFDA